MIYNPRLSSHHQAKRVCPCVPKHLLTHFNKTLGVSHKICIYSLAKNRFTARRDYNRILAPSGSRSALFWLIPYSRPAIYTFKSIFSSLSLYHYVDVFMNMCQDISRHLLVETAQMGWWNKAHRCWISVQMVNCSYLQKGESNMICAGLTCPVILNKTCL